MIASKFLFAFSSAGCSCFLVIEASDFVGLKFGRDNSKVYVHYGQLLLGKQQQNEDAEMRNQDE